MRDAGTGVDGCDGDCAAEAAKENMSMAGILGQLRVSTGIESKDKSRDLMARIDVE